MRPEELAILVNGLDLKQAQPRKLIPRVFFHFHHFLLTELAIISIRRPFPNTSVKPFGSVMSAFTNTFTRTGTKDRFLACV